MNSITVGGSDADVIGNIVGQLDGSDPGEALFADATINAMARIRARSAAEYQLWRSRLKAAGAHYMTLRGLDAATGTRARAIRKGETVEVAI